MAVDMELSALLLFVQYTSVGISVKVSEIRTCSYKLVAVLKLFVSGLSGERRGGAGREREALSQRGRA